MIEAGIGRNFVGRSSPCNKSCQPFLSGFPPCNAYFFIATIIKTTRSPHHRRGVSRL
jgi:hypothetical protein